VRSYYIQQEEVDELHVEININHASHAVSNYVIDRKKKNKTTTMFVFIIQSFCVALGASLVNEKHF
jgi:hypothetical protein